MSIAVSAVIRPSPVLYLFSIAAALAVLAISCVIGLGAVGEIPAFARVLISLFCLLFAFVSLHKFHRSRKTLRIDISGIGQIRLTHYSELDHLQNEVHASSQKYRLLELMDGSTLWSCLLLLRLKDENGVMHFVPILPDSVSSTEFKSLSVALRWIAARHKPAAE